MKYQHQTISPHPIQIPINSLPKEPVFPTFANQKGVENWRLLWFVNGHGLVKVDHETIQGNLGKIENTREDHSGRWAGGWLEVFEIWLQFVRCSEMTETWECEQILNFKILFYISHIHKVRVIQFPISQLVLDPASNIPKFLSSLFPLVFDFWFYPLSYSCLCFHLSGFRYLWS